MLVVAACTKPNLQPCTDAEDCSYRTGGECVENPVTGTSWCAFADGECASGLRWGDATVGDDLAGTCVLGADAAECVGAGCPGDVDGPVLPCDSPDRLTYIHQKPANFFDIYGVDVDGNNSQNLTNSGTTGHALDAEFAWDRRGRKIAYASATSGGSRIWTVNGDGTSRNPLTAGFMDLDPSWSPDGEYVAYTHGESALGPYNIFVIPFGSALDEPVSTGDEDVRSAWSSSGTTIAFFSTRDSDEGLYLTQQDGTDEHALSMDPSAINQTHLPRWSPTGERIAWIGPGGGGYDIWAIDADGQNLHNVTMSVDDETSVQWMPDGERLVYTVNNDIHVVHVDGSNDAPLVATGAAEKDAAVNPNATHVAWAGNEDGNWEIYVAPIADTTDSTRLTNNTVDDLRPTWRPCTDD